MKKECANTRKSLRKYLRGHLFKFEQVRIARHLNACPLCRSEFQALKKVADTKQLLRDITPPEGLARMKAGFFVLAKLRLLLYRPLWLAGIIGAAVLVYINVISANRHDVEIENLEKSVPPSAVVASAPTVTPATTAAAPHAAATQPTGTRTAAQAPAVEPLVITISPRNRAAIRQINEAMRGHAQLRKMKFSDAVSEISGDLTAKELSAFFTRIEEAGKVSYSRKRFESFPAAEPIPFIVKMKPVPVEEQAAVIPKPAGASAVPVSAPTPSVP